MQEQHHHHYKFARQLPNPISALISVVSDLIPFPTGASTTSDFRGNPGLTAAPPQSSTATSTRLNPIPTTLPRIETTSALSSSLINNPSTLIPPSTTLTSDGTLDPVQVTVLSSSSSALSTSIAATSTTTPISSLASTTSVSLTRTAVIVTSTAAASITTVQPTLKPASPISSSSSATPSVSSLSNTANSNSLSTGAMVGIISGSVVGLLLLAAIVAYLIQKKKRDRDMDESFNADLFTKTQFRRESVMLDDRNFMGGEYGDAMEVQDYHNNLAGAGTGFRNEKMAEYDNAGGISRAISIRSEPDGCVGHNGHDQLYPSMARNNIPGAARINGDLSNPRAPSMFIHHHQQQKQQQRNFDPPGQLPPPKNQLRYYHDNPPLQRSGSQTSQLNSNYRQPDQRDRMTSAAESDSDYSHHYQSELIHRSDLINHHYDNSGNLVERFEEQVMRSGTPTHDNIQQYFTTQNQTNISDYCANGTSNHGHGGGRERSTTAESFITMSNSTSYGSSLGAYDNLSGNLNLGEGAQLNQTRSAKLARVIEVNRREEEDDPYAGLA